MLTHLTSWEFLTKLSVGAAVKCRGISVIRLEDEEFPSSVFNKIHKRGQWSINGSAPLTLLPAIDELLKQLKYKADEVEEPCVASQCP